MIKKILLISVIFFGFLHSYAHAQNPKSVGKFKNWETFTYNDGKGYNLGTGAAHVAAGINRVSSITVDLDFAAITTARAAAGLTALGAADILEVIKVPAKTPI